MKPSRRSLWTARAMWGIAVSFLTFDAIGKLLQVPAVIEGSARLGYPEHSVLAIGVIEMVCVALYVVPRTAVLGALMLTGYLGGAVATHFRIEDPLFTHLLFPIYVAVLLWGALVLSDGRVRRLVLGPRTMLPAPDVRLTEEVQS